MATKGVGTLSADFKYTIPEGTKPSICKGPNCQKEIFFFKHPRKDGSPGWAVADADGTPHHKTCVDVGQFKKK